MENVLCVIDPTTSSQPALERAVAFAKKTGAELELFICDYSGFLGGPHFLDSDSLDRARERLLERHKSNLTEFAEKYREPGLEIRVDAVWDHPLHEGIVRHAYLSAADIVIKDTHLHPGLGLTGLSNSDWNLMRTCPVPLWLVKPGDFPEQPKLIAAIDPMHVHDKPAALDEEILQLTALVGNAVDGEVHVFHAYDPALLAEPTPLIPNTADYAAAAEIKEQFRARNEARFLEVAENHGIASDRSHFSLGEAHRLLPDLAATIDASLVVMGSVSRGRLKRVFIGSTAERTLDRLPCDLLIVKPTDFKTSVDLDPDA